MRLNTYWTSLTISNRSLCVCVCVILSVSAELHQEFQRQTIWQTVVLPQSNEPLSNGSTGLRLWLSSASHSSQRTCSSHLSLRFAQIKTQTQSKSTSKTQLPQGVSNLTLPCQRNHLPGNPTGAYCALTVVWLSVFILVKQLKVEFVCFVSCPFCFSRKTKSIFEEFELWVIVNVI